MQSTSGFDLATNLMEDYQLFTSASTSSLDKASSQVFYFHSDNENGAGAEAGTQQLDDNNKSQPSGISSSGEIKVKPGKTDGVNKDTRRHRYAFQTRSQVDILDDGYRWRKYGQKAVKNNKFPRSYYKCTHKGCNVKKQVQRNSKDEETVVTTYEGIHIHPTERSFQNFEDILRQMQTYTPF